MQASNSMPSAIVDAAASNGASKPTFRVTQERSPLHSNDRRSTPGDLEEDEEDSGESEKDFDQECDLESDSDDERGDSESENEQQEADDLNDKIAAKDSAQKNDCENLKTNCKI